MRSRTIPLLLAVLTLAGSPAAGQSVYSQAAAHAHRGAGVHYAIASLNNGVLTTVNDGGFGSVSGTPTGPGVTSASTFATMPGFGGGDNFGATATGSVDLATARLTGAVVNTPVNFFGSPAGFSNNALHDAVYFLNSTSSPIVLAVSYQVEGGVATHPSAPTFVVRGQMHLYSLGSAYPLPPALRGGAAVGEAVRVEVTETGVAFYEGAWTPLPLGTGPTWTTGLASGFGGVLQTELTLPPGLSSVGIGLTLDLECRGGITCDYGQPTQGARFAFGTLPAGLTVASASGTFLGAPVPQPTPSNLSIVSLVGNRATFRWTPPTTVAATGYVLEGGVLPGQVLGSLPTGSTAATFTVDLPTGAFYVRIHALTASGRSAPTNEVRVFVNVPQPPAAPTNLLGLVNGSVLGLSWFNPPTGGMPTSMVLDVSGTVNTSLRFPPGERFAYPSVPPGTYTFTVRAENAAGSSPASAPLTLDFPGSCSGVPQTPVQLSATDTGRFLTVSWEPPAAGPAVASYVLDVSGAATLSVPLVARAISSPVPPGSYTFVVRSVNACGASASSVPVSVTVP